MKNLIKYLLILFLFFTNYTCKRKTTFRVKVHNYALDEPTPNAKVALIERNDGALLSSNQCKVIASALTDAYGYCTFDNERLRKSERDYFIAVTEAYGFQIGYDCALRSFGFLKAGDTKDQIQNTDFVQGNFVVQYNNLLNPSTPGDSLLVSLVTIEYPNPKGSGSTIVQGGGGVFVNWNKYNSASPPIPTVFLMDPIKTKAQRLKRYVYKRKMGIVTEKIDTVKVYPIVTSTIVIDW